MTVQYIGWYGCKGAKMRAIQDRFHSTFPVAVLINISFLFPINRFGSFPLCDIDLVTRSAHLTGATAAAVGGAASRTKDI
jgi:hypothetical protein